MPREFTRTVISCSPSSRNRLKIVTSVSASASTESAPTVSKSHWMNSRYRPFCGFSARQTVPSAYRLNGVPSSFACWAAKRASGTVRSNRIATSRPPLSVKRKSCLSVSPPPLPSKISVFSSAGVSIGAKPCRRKTSRATCIIRSRTSMRSGRKSRKPLSVSGLIRLGFSAMAAV